jgi:LysM repeat protein
MSTHRKPRLSTARKRARAVTLCAATFSAAAVPVMAQAATSSTSSTVKPAQPAKSGQHPAGKPKKAKSAPKASTETTSAKTASSSTTSSSSSSSSGETSYTVVSGDTLSAIAERALGDGDDYTELFKLNKDRSEPNGGKLSDADLIDVGWTIELPSGSKSAVAGTSSSTSSSSSSSSSSTTAETASSTSSSSSSTSSDSSSSSTSSSSSSSSYADDLTGWIDEAISILGEHGYSVSYNAVYETAINESSGNPDAENDSDSNAASGNPSKGLMQTTQTTFDAYALSGYDDIWNPVDNIIAAAIYAQDTYGGLDTVVSDRCGGSCWYGY